MAAAAELASNAAERGAELASNAAEKGAVPHPLPGRAPYVSLTVREGRLLRAAPVSLTCTALAGRAWWAKVKSTVGFEEMQEEEPAQTSLLTQINEATSLNRMQVSASRAARPLCDSTACSRSGPSSLTLVFVPAEDIRLSYQPGACAILWFLREYKPSCSCEISCQPTLTVVLTPLLTKLPAVQSQSTFFVVFPTKFAILYTFANICALARRVSIKLDPR